MTSAGTFYANDEWFWQAWSETISKRYEQSLTNHYRSHAQGTIVNPATLISEDFLEQYAALVMLLERFPAAPRLLAGELFGWRPKTYEDYFRASDLQDAQFAIAAFAHAPSSIRRAFLNEVAYLDEDAMAAIEAVHAVITRGRPDLVPRICRERAMKIRRAIMELARLISGEPPQFERQAAEKQRHLKPPPGTDHA